MSASISVYVYDGQIAIGALRDVGPDKVIAFTINAAGRKMKVGQYKSRALAMRALRGTVPPPASAAFNPRRVEPSAGPRGPSR